MRDRNIETVNRLIARTYAEVEADRERIDRSLATIERTLRLIRKADRMRTWPRERSNGSHGPA